MLHSAKSRRAETLILVTFEHTM